MNAEVDVFPAVVGFLVGRQCVLGPAEVHVFPAVVGLLVGRQCVHVNLRIHTKTRGCNGSLKGLLMMGIIVPETC
jgi:hypothetical protein